LLILKIYCKKHMSTLQKHSKQKLALSQRWLSSALARPSLTLSPPRNATQDGYHSGAHFEEPMGPFSYLQTMLETDVAKYKAKIPTDPSHPFILGTPKDWWANAWAVVLDGPSRQISHAHNTASFSGIHHIQFPAEIDSGKDKKRWIEFGTPPLISLAN